MDTNINIEKKKLLGDSVEESRVKRVEKQQSRYRDRGGIFVPAETNPLLDILLARGINGESPVKVDASRQAFCQKSRSKSPTKRRRVDDTASTHTDGENGKLQEGGHGKGKSKRANHSVTKANKRKVSGGELSSQPVAGPSNLHDKGQAKNKEVRKKQAKKRLRITDSDEDDRLLARSQRDLMDNHDLAPIRPPTGITDSGHVHDRTDDLAHSVRSRRQLAGDGHDGRETAPTTSEVQRSSGERKPRSKPKMLPSIPEESGDPSRSRRARATKRSKHTPPKGDDEVYTVDDQSEVARAETARKNPQRRQPRREKTKKEPRSKKGKDPAPKTKSKENAGGASKVVDTRDYLPDMTPGGSEAKSPASPRRAEHSQFCPTERKRPWLYVSSDFDSEDDIPLRKPVRKGRATVVDYDSTEAASAAERIAEAETNIAERSQETPVKDIKRKPKKHKGSGRPTSQVAETTVDAKYGVPVREEEGEEHGVHLGAKGNAHKLKGKGRARSATAEREAPSRATSEAKAQNEDKTDSHARKRSRKRDQPEIEEEESQNGARNGGEQTIKHKAKRRRKEGVEADADEETAQESRIRHRAGKSSSDHHNEPSDQENNNAARPTSRSLKENRKAHSSARTKGKRNAPRFRNPKPRLSMFPEPRMAIDSEDEIDFLR